MKINKILSTLILGAILALPVVAMAAPVGPPTGVTWSQIDAFVKGVVYLIGGLILVVMFLISGIMFMTASGDAEKIKTARSTLLYAAVGTAVMLIAASILAIIDAWL